MSEYEDASFENDSNKSKASMHCLKLSIDLLSVKNVANAANVFAQYQLDLTDKHSFMSQPPTPVQTGAQETRLQNGFAAFDFVATKQQLFQILNDRSVTVRLFHRS